MKYENPNFTIKCNYPKVLGEYDTNIKIKCNNFIWYGDLYKQEIYDSLDLHLKNYPIDEDFKFYCRIFDFCIAVNKIDKHSFLQFLDNLSSKYDCLFKNNLRDYLLTFKFIKRLSILINGHIKASVLYHCLGHLDLLEEIYVKEYDIYHDLNILKSLSSKNIKTILMKLKEDSLYYIEQNISSKF